MNLCVFGAASNAIDPKFLTGAEALGRCLAKAGLGVVFGGGATGVMGALARGVLAENGTLIGVAPRFFDQPGALVTQGRMEFTDTMAQRKTRMEDLSQGFLVAPGGIGTMEEFFEVLTLRQLGRHFKPIGILNLDGCYDGLVELMRDMVAGGFLDKATFEGIRVFTGPEECARWFAEALQETVLVSACLLGQCCTYRGDSNFCQKVLDAPGVKIPVCPEQLGGLSTPRTPAECKSGGVFTRDGGDVTEAYRLGAEKALEIAKENHCPRAILKARSLSCGVGSIYDGNFCHKEVPCDGITAGVLRRAGLGLQTEEEL